MCVVGLAIGTIDGVNTTFNAPGDYKTGSLLVYLNGQALFGCATEGVGTSFTLDNAPEIGDTVEVKYTPI